MKEIWAVESLTCGCVRDGRGAANRRWWSPPSPAQ